MFSGWYGGVCFLVSPLPSAGGGELSELAGAGKAAVDRFQFVTEQGVELPGAWAVFEDDVPNAFVGPCLVEDGVAVGADGRDAIWPPQAATMLRIVLGELQSRKLSASVSCPPAGLDVWNLPAWSSIAESPSDGGSRARDDSGKRWFVQRTVRSVTTTGVGYTDLEWLQPDRTWSRDKSGAITYEHTPDGRAAVTELAIRLREEADAAGRDPRLGSPTGVLTSPDEAVGPNRLPPDAIRDHGHVWREPSSEG
jgi:hypothetical protein